MGVRNVRLLSEEVGLSSEEYNPLRRQLVGNFPQVFSHVALINGAFNLTRAQMPRCLLSGARKTWRRAPRKRRDGPDQLAVPAPSRWLSAISRDTNAGDASAGTDSTRNTRTARHSSDNTDARSRVRRTRR